MTYQEANEETKEMCATFSEGAKANIAKAAKTGDWGRALYLEGVVQGLRMVQSYLTSEAEFIRDVERVFSSKRPYLMEITDQEYAAAVARGEEIHQRGHAIAARYDRKTKRVVIELHNGLEVSFSPDIHQDLAGASDDDLSEIELWGAGLDVRWPRLDGDVYIPSLMADSFGTRAWMASRLSATGEKRSFRELPLPTEEHRPQLEALAAIPDELIDFSDIPELTDEQLAQMRPASFHRPFKK